MADSFLSIEILKMLLSMKREDVQREINQIEQAPQLSEKLKEMKKEINRLQMENEKLRKETKSADQVNYGQFSEKKLKEVKQELEKTKQELDDANKRLSQLMGSKMTDNNPAITDLSDVNRPQKLGQRYSELYDNQWTDAFGTLQDDPSFGDERQIVDMLLKILVNTMDFCKSSAESHKQSITNTLLMRDDAACQFTLTTTQSKLIKDVMKVTAPESGLRLFEKYRSKLGRENDMYSRYAMLVTPYLKECFSICWLMCVQDPSVVFGPLPRHGAAFDKNSYKAYTQGGTIVDFVVWPAMFLFQGGNVLCRGVAQCQIPYTPHYSSPKHAWPSSPETQESYARKHEDKIRSRDRGYVEQTSYDSYSTSREDIMRSLDRSNFKRNTAHSSRSYHGRDKYSEDRIPQHILDDYKFYAPLYANDIRKLKEKMGGTDNYNRCVEYFRQKRHF